VANDFNGAGLLSDYGPSDDIYLQWCLRNGSGNKRDLSLEAL
jgi:hypothetical protein